MANTTNLNLSKLSGTEKLKTFPTPYSDNMDAIDGAFGAGFGVSGKPTVNAEINSLADGMAIISNNNTHAAITAGQFVYVRNHGSLANGLYVATTNIAANATLSGSNLTSDSNGGLNSVYASLNSKIQYFTTSLVYLDQLTWTQASSASPYVATVVPSSDISGTLIAATIFRTSSWTKETTSLTVTMYDNQIALAIDDTSHFTSSSRVSIRYVVMN